MPELPEGKAVTIGDNEFNFSLAETGIDLITGLKGVTSLGTYDGMLFDFGQEFYPIMTPKGLVFSIEVAFISEDGVIQEFKVLDPVNGLTQSASKRARYALEVPIGFFVDNNIHVGDTINL
jgi:uncharacterized membrane protein (UPF0127 family)